MCLYPKLIKNRKYTANKKNRGIIPPLPIIDGKPDQRVLYVPVGCGKCMECRKKKSREWQIRLLEEVKHDKKGEFVTLTFSNQSIKELSKEIKNLDGYERDNEIARLGVRRFLERWRKKYKKSVKHWLITELGHDGTENIHLHGIIWTEEREDISNIWKYGYVWTAEKGKGYISEQTVNYITKYVQKIDQIHKYYEPKMLTSQGIGKKYAESINARNNKYNKKGTDESYKNRQGYKMTLPVYYRNKIYTDEEKEKLWVEKLNKKERWVGGEKVDISENEEDYYNTLEYYRKMNKRLGYGDDKINWDRKKYERDRRNMNFNERTKTGKISSKIINAENEEKIEILPQIKPNEAF